MADKKSTTVVPYVNVSCKQDLTPPLNLSPRRLKGRKQMYPAEQLTRILKNPENILFFTEKSKRDAAKYKLTNEKMATLIGCFTLKNFAHSEWCETGTKDASGKHVIPADVYKKTIKLPDLDDPETLRDIEFYFKLGINHTGKMILMISNHAS